MLFCMNKVIHRPMDAAWPFGLSSRMAHATVLTMKKIAAAILRFFLGFGVSMLCLSSVWALGAYPIGGSPLAVVSLGMAAVAFVPAAVILASFLTFFLLNRLTSSRLRGGITLIALASLTVVGVALLARFLGPSGAVAPSSLPGDYGPIAEWMLEASTAPWPLFAAAYSSLAVYAASFWGLTRLSRSRPLIGAFIAPSAAIAAIRLLSLCLSEPASAIFPLIGLDLPRLYGQAAIVTAGALALALFDLLFARKPSGGGRDA